MDHVSAPTLTPLYQRFTFFTVIYCNFYLFVDNRGKGSSDNDITPQSQYVKVNSEGMCNWQPRYDQAVTQCFVDVRWFPFDEQKCDLIFESWNLRKTELEIDLYESDSLDYYVESDEYDLIGAYTRHYRLL